MTDVSDSSLEEVRRVLLGADNLGITELQQQVLILHERVRELEALLIEREDRAGTVGTVLPEAFGGLGVKSEAVSAAMKPTTVRAIHLSARDESDELAVALYPVLGPAVRKMIANLLSFGPPDGGTFAVEQVLLIERETGLLLAATSNDGDTEEADIVSGMLDAIRMFVQDAFDTSEHDGLRDLRVGNVTVLVEWGPKAVLASVIRGVPDDEYRTRAAELLELLHRRFDDDFQATSGVAASLDDAIPALHDLRSSVDPPSSKGAAVAVAVVLIVLVVALILLLVLGSR